MNDQASKLRELIKQRDFQKKIYTKMKIYSIASGKGGVGKTNISLNMAIAMKVMGKRVLLVDADLGLANVDVVAGLYHTYNISHIITLGKTINEIIVEGPAGIKILPGASGLADMADLSYSDINLLINAFKSIADTYDIVIIDNGAGISKSVMSFIQSSDEIIIVTTPDPSAMADAYALMKLIYRYFDKIHLIINRAENFKQAQSTLEKLSGVAKKFLNKNIDYLGYVLEDKTVFRANMEQVPFYSEYPNSLASKCITNISQKLLFGDEMSSQKQNSMELWFKRLFYFLKNEKGGRG